MGSGHHAICRPADDHPRIHHHHHVDGGLVGENRVTISLNERNIDKPGMRGERMVHLVSADKERLLGLGQALGLRPEWLQYKPLKDPRTGARVPAWHWDVWGERLNRLV